MAIPPTASRFMATLDPHEELDFVVSLAGLLEEGELIASYILVILPEAVALGLEFMTGTGRDHALRVDKRAIDFWLSIDDAFKSDPAFDGGGVALPMEVTVVTTSIPSRTRTRTFLIQVAQQ